MDNRHLDPYDRFGTNPAQIHYSPQAAAAWVAGALGSATTITGAVTLGSAFATGIGVGLAYVGTYLAATAALAFGLSSAAKALGLYPDLPDFSDDLGNRLSSSFESMPPRAFVYGRCRVSGPISYIDADQRDTDTDKNEMLFYETIIAGHEIESFDTIYLNDEEVTSLSTTSNSAWPEGDTATSDANGVARYRPGGTTYFDKMMLKLHTGSSSQLADSDMIAGTNIEASGGRSSSDRGRGIAYIAAAAFIDPEVFSNGQPTISATIKGKKDIYDPRDASTGYSDNPALCLANWLTTPEEEGGYGLAWSDINETFLSEAANDCDDAIDTWDGGSTSKRYTCGGRFYATTEPITIINNFLQAMNGTIERINGKICIRAGVSRLPELTLTESDWVAPISIQTTTPISDSYNSIKPVLSAEDNDWQVSDVEAVTGEIKYDIGTVDDSANTFSQPSTDFEDDDMVRFQVWTGSGFDNSKLPSGITENTFYYVVNSGASTWQISTSSGGTAVDFGALSSGTLVAFKDVYLARDNGVRRERGSTFSLVTDPITTRRLAFTALKLDRNEIVVSGACSLKAIDLAIGDTVRYIDSERGFFATTGSSFDADTVTSDVDIETYQPEGVVVYEQDTSSGTDIFGASAGTRTGNIDSIGGRNDVLRYYPNSTNTLHFSPMNFGDYESGETYNFSIDVFIPSGNSNVTGLLIDYRGATTGTDYDNLATDQWNTITLSGIVPASTGAISLYQIASGTTTFAGAGSATDDLIYFSNASLTKLTGDGPIDRGYIEETAHGLSDGDPLKLIDADGSGLREDIVYYVADATTDTFRLARYPDTNLREMPPSGHTLTLQPAIGKLFEVVYNTLSSENNTLVCPLVLREANDDDYDWDDGYVTEPDPGEGVDLPSIRDVDDVNGLTLESGTDQLILGADGSIVVRVRVSWDGTGNSFVTIGGKFEIQWKLASEQDESYRSHIVDGSTTEMYLNDMEETDINVRIRAINSANYMSEWVLWDDGEGGNNYTVVGKSEPPNNVSNLAFTNHDPLTLQASLTWDDPSDLDLYRIDIYYDVDTGSGYSGTLAYLASVLPGVGTYTGGPIYSQGTSSDWKFVVKTVDTTGNESTDEPWPEVIETIDPIAGVTGLSVTARSAANGGLQINPTWTDDTTTSDVATQWWRKDVDGDEKGAEISFTKMSKEGVDIDIPLSKMDTSGADYVATVFWLRVWRRFLINNQHVWSDADSVEVTVQPDQKAPDRVTGITIAAYDPKVKSVQLSWSLPSDPDLDHMRILRQRSTSATPGTWLTSHLIGTVNAPGVIFEDPNVWADGQSYYYHYKIETVDRLGNRNTSTSSGQNIDKILVEAESAPTISSITARSEGSGISIVWPSNAAYEDDDMWIQWGKDGDEDTIDDKRVPYKQGHPTLAGANLGTVIFLPAGSAGDWWVRIYRVFKFNGYDVWTEPYNHGSWITVTEDTVAPGAVSNLTATYEEDSDVVELQWNTRTEIDLSHYNVWRRKYQTSPPAWGDWVKVASVPAAADNDDDTNVTYQSKVRFEDPVPWQEVSGGTDFQYQIKAIDQAGNASTGTTSATLTVENTDPPADPANVSYTFGAEGPTITWDQPYEKDYEYTYIERRKGSTGTDWKPAGRAKGDSYVDGACPPNISAITGTTREWYYRIRHGDKAGNMSNYVEATLASGNRYRPKPSAVTSVALSFDGIVSITGSNVNTKVTYSWTDNSDTAYVYVVIRRSNEFFMRGPEYDASSEYILIWQDNSTSASYTLDIYNVDEYGNFSDKATDTETYDNTP